MTITDRLRLELFLREQLSKHGEDFYLELAKVLEKIQLEQEDMRGKPNLIKEMK